MSNNNKIKYLYFEGGGFKTIGYVSPLKYFEETKKLELKSVGGSDFGALIALSYILGYSYNNLESLIFSKMEKPFKVVSENSVFYMTHSVPRIVSKYGLIGNELIDKVVSNILSEKQVPIDITFKQLYDKYNIDFVCSGHNVSYERNELFSSKLTSNMCIKTALLITLCVPLVFDPIVYNNNIYIGGGSFNDISKSMDYFKDTYEDYTTSNSVHLMLKTKKRNVPIEFKNVFEFYINFIGQISNSNTDTTKQTDYDGNVIVIDLDEDIKSIYYPSTKINKKISEIDFVFQK